MNYLTTEQFNKYFKFEGDTIILSPNIAMIASFGEFVFDTNFEPHNSNLNEYDTAMIDIVECNKFPFAKAKHEYSWLISAIQHVKIGGKIIAKIPLKICSHSSLIKNVKIANAWIYDNFAIVEFQRTKTESNSLIFYGNDVVEINSKNVPILTQNNMEYYSYFQLVSDKDSFQYISLTGGGKKSCREQYQSRVEWDTNRVICISTGSDNRKINNNLNMYTFDEIADKNRAVDCFYVPEDIDFDTFVNTLKSKKFLSFLSSVCYNNYQTFHKHFKKKVFNKKIVEFCNEK